MNRLDEIMGRRLEIASIAERHNALGIAVFGSCARKEDDATSDVDFLVDFNSEATLFDQIAIQLELTKLLGCKVDVVSRRGLAPSISDEVQREAIAI